MGNSFRGAGVALITPFKDDLKVDFSALGNIVDNQIENGIDFLVVLGTTAETATLKYSEKQEIIDFVCSRNAGKVPVMVGVGGNDTLAVIENLKSLDLSKADGILSVVPYYSKPTQEGIYQHFMAIEQNCELPIVLYNVPGRTGVSMSAETTLRLAHASSKFVGTKEASGNFTEICRILKDKPKSFALVSGDDSLLVPITSIGGEGIISVAANALPKVIAEMTHAAMNGDFTTAGAIQIKIQKLLDNLFIEGNPAGVKAAMHFLGMIDNMLRLPLVPVSEKIYQTIAEEVKMFK
jgi:4-hydroxy-tetrahydrodipicolinate synthase